MDENIKLEGIRTLVRQIREASAVGGPVGYRLRGDWALELADAIAELDAALSDNEMLPLAWLPPEAAKGGTAGTGKK